MCKVYNTLHGVQSVVPCKMWTVCAEHRASASPEGVFGGVPSKFLTGKKTTQLDLGYFACFQEPAQSSQHLSHPASTLFSQLPGTPPGVRGKRPCPEATLRSLRPPTITTGTALAGVVRHRLPGHGNVVALGLIRPQQHRMASSGALLAGQGQWRWREAGTLREECKGSIY